MQSGTYTIKRPSALSARLKILFHCVDAVVKGNLSTRKKALKVELRKAREKRRLAKGQVFPLEQRQCEFCLQLGLSQLGCLEKLIWQSDGHGDT